METILSKQAETQNIEIPDGDIHKIIEKIQNDLKEFDLKTDEVCKRTGMSREQLEKYVSNPSNFSAEEWKVLQKVKIDVESFKNKIWDAIEKDPNEEIEKQKKNEQKSKSRRMKGMQKKNWIPMS